MWVYVVETAPPPVYIDRGFASMSLVSSLVYPEITFDTSTFRPDHRGEGAVWDAWRGVSASSIPPHVLRRPRPGHDGRDVRAAIGVGTAGRRQSTSGALGAGPGAGPDSFTADVETDNTNIVSNIRSAHANGSVDVQYPSSHSTYTYEDTYHTLPVPLSALNADIMDAAFTRAAVPFRPAHRLRDRLELGVAWGYNGRFMAFLASDSVPVKATMYDEYFPGWIEPWVHYIPLSTSYSEIYNIVSYFSGPPPSVLSSLSYFSHSLSSSSRSVSAGAGASPPPSFKPASDSPHSAAETEKRRALARWGGEGVASNAATGSAKDKESRHA
ncbi:hypothetical protein C8R43DRAFT_940420 [Mycena crocata]|nr:hypothetical protein C8R43DRAFT_940420 [Mycena crocata]